MNLIRLSLLLVCFGTLVTSCRDREPQPTSAELSPAQRESVVQAGDEASAALMKNLGSQLKAAMASGGPVAAVQVCQQAAEPITQSTNQEFEGVTVSRTSLKVRNPKNAPDETDWTVLEAWQSLADAGKPLPAHEVRSVTEKEARFYKPILVQEVCLNCHGPSESLKPELRALLDESYPDDQARGYAEGDLRGAFRVTIDLTQS